ncbi:hypothetical protein SCHPADRAFT_944198 [Schizopora paradoxa]|uniref:Uncharacterized protein n=1 Tax=Schizopora paradoxa TaxID=27342 RepID=A0A0H2RBE1_9AGAM|nr:hypothetical protein SCHPADRAFT_944198 [Schizopora paradoxa]
MEIETISGSSKEFLVDSKLDHNSTLDVPVLRTDYGQRQRWRSPRWIVQVVDHWHPERYSVRIKMLTLIVLAVVIMVVNDQIYLLVQKESRTRTQAFNDLVSVSEDALEVGAQDIQSALQRITNIVGNLFGTIANMLLSGVIGLAFMQIFWRRMRNKVHTLAEINSAMSCSSHPFGVGSLKSWKSMFWLSAIPALAIANTQIILFASGSIHAQPTSFNHTCGVFTVNLTNANLVGPGAVTSLSNASAAQQQHQQTFNFSNAKAQVQSYVTQVIVLDEPIPPYVDVENLDSYNVTFDAPALRCEDDSGANLTSILPLPDPSQTNASIPIWTTVYNPNSGSASPNLTFTTATRNLASSDDGVIVPDEANQQIVLCTFFNASYFVKVKSGNDGYNAHVEHNETAPLTIGGSSTDGIAYNNFLAIADTFAKTLNGSASFDPVTFDFTPDSPIIVFSFFGEEEPDVPWSLGSNVKLTKAIPKLMDFVVVGLLSNLLNSGTATSSDRSSSSSSQPKNTALLSRVGRECVIDGIAFQYDRSRLILSYCGGILYTSLIALASVLAIKANGAEESMDFSRIVKAVVNNHLLVHKDRLDDNETMLLADDGGFQIKVIETPHDPTRREEV